MRDVIAAASGPNSMPTSHLWNFTITISTRLVDTVSVPMLPRSLKNDPKRLITDAGVGDVDVSLSAGQATVHYDESATSPAYGKSAVTGGAYGAGVINEAQSRAPKGSCCG